MASPHLTQEALACRLSAELTRYEEAMHAVAGRWPDLELYTGPSRHMDQLRLCCSALPQLSVPWITLLIAHSELLHCLWKWSGKDDPSSCLQASLDEHALAVDALRQRALALLSDLPPVASPASPAAGPRDRL